MEEMDGAGTHESTFSSFQRPAREPSALLNTRLPVNKAAFQEKLIACGTRRLSRKGS